MILGDISKRAYKQLDSGIKKCLELGSRISLERAKMGLTLAHIPGLRLIQNPSAARSVRAFMKENLPGMDLKDARNLICEAQSQNLVKCRVCGCSQERACKGGCSWIETDLCSSCKNKG